MKNYDPSSLKWGICDASDRLIAAFDDQASAQSFYQTISGSGRLANQTLHVVDLTTGQRVDERELASDRVS